MQRAPTESREMLKYEGKEENRAEEKRGRDESKKKK